MKAYMNCRSLALLTALLALVFAGADALAQISSSSIRGQVTDPSGTPLPGASNAVNKGRPPKSG